MAVLKLPFLVSRGSNISKGGRRTSRRVIKVAYLIKIIFEVVGRRRRSDDILHLAAVYPVYRLQYQVCEAERDR